jgi:hypothetical protein
VIIDLTQGQYSPLSGMQGFDSQVVDPYAFNRRPQPQYADSQPAAQQGGGMNPMQMYNMYSQFASPATGGAGGASAGAEAGASGATSGASGAGSMMSSAGPWAALAAIIIANEYNAKKGGYRAEDDSEYAKDLITGKVLQQDLTQRWLPKAFGEYSNGRFADDKLGIGSDMLAGANIATGRPKDAIEALKGGTVGRLLSKIF